MVNGQRPSATTTNGSTGAASVHPLQREQLTVLVVEVNPVLAPVLAVRDELEILAEHRMEPVRHPHTSVPIVSIGGS
jgi:hypothetical protein